MTDNWFLTFQGGVVATYSKYLRRILEAENSRSQNIGTKYPVPHVIPEEWRPQSDSVFHHFN
jgi:hypothetical protein